MATAACPRCGHDVPDDATQCPSCHRPVDDQPPEGPQAPPEPGEERPRKKWDLTIVASGVLLVVIVVVAWLL